jgi:hypothetical protein
VQISISPGNKKLKNIASFSLPPVASCLNHKHCASKCYALKAFRAYPNVKKAYSRNFDIVKSDLKDFENQMEKFLSNYEKKYFRIHVSGDFFSQEYLNSWIILASKFKKIRFKAFTKSYWLNFDNKPANMEIVFSTFDTMPKGTDEKLKKKYDFPIAAAGEKNPDESKYENCEDDCSVCKKCWHLSETGKNVFFKYH